MSTKRFILILNALSLVIAIFWWVYKPDFEPALTTLVLLATLIGLIVQERVSVAREKAQPPAVNLPTSTCPCYSAPASVFIAGDHAVMFGHAAVYLPLPVRVRVTVEPDTRSTGVSFTNFRIPDPSNPKVKRRIEDCAHYHREIGIGKDEERKLDGLFRDLILPFVPKCATGEPPGFRLHVDSDFPVACGLDGSGAIAACLAKALVDCFISVYVHAADIIDAIYLNTEMPEKHKDEQMASAYHELLCEGLGSLSILTMNSVLWDWALVPDLMNAYQASLNVAGVSNSKIQSVIARVLQEALDRQLSASIGCKITGCGRGGDIVILSLNTTSSQHDELVQSVAQKEDVSLHFQSTDFAKDAWEQVQGVRKEA
jgi:mevalonate kinase